MKKKYTMGILIMILFGIAVIFLVIFATAKERTRVSSIQAEIAALEAEAKRIEKDNADLGEKIAFFETDHFREREAKEKLNYQKTNERVVIIKKNTEKIDEENSVEQEEQNTIPLPNYRKWINQFIYQ